MDTQMQMPTRVEHNSQPVLTTEQLAIFYGCSINQIHNNFKNNADRFVEGVHYFKVEGAELKNLRLKNFELQISPMVRAIYLWTVQGAARHAKMLNTDNAWKVFNTLEEHYFKVKKPSTPDADTTSMLTLANQIIGNPDFIIKICENWKADREKLAAAEKQIAAAEKQIEQMAPKSDYCEKVLDSDELVPLTLIAKDYGYSAVEFNRLLQHHEIQYRRAGHWFLCQEYAQRGWTQSQTFLYHSEDGVPHTKTHMYWTQKGRYELHELLKKRGICPLSEALIDY